MDDTRQFESAKERKKRQRKDDLIIFAYAVVGLIITIVSFLLFHFFQNDIVLTVLVCVVDVVYTYFNALIFFKSKDWKYEKYIFIPLLMLVYWTLLFAAVCAINGMVLKGPFSYNFFLYPIFLMPSFVIEILAVGLILEYM